MELISRVNRSRLPIGYGAFAPTYAPSLPVPEITLGQLVRQGELDQGQAYQAMTTGRVPASIQSRYVGVRVTPGQRGDFQTSSKTAYELYEAGKLSESEALDAIYSGKVPDALQDRFPTINVLPGDVDEDPSYRFWNAFGLGSLANPHESLLKKIGLMTLGGGALNLLTKPIDVAVGEVLHAADPSDNTTFEDRLLHTGDHDKTVGDNFFHSTLIGSRLDPDKYKADAKKYDHNVWGQGAGAVLRLAGLDGLQEAVNDDTDKTPLYRGLKGGISGLGAAAQLLPFAEGAGAAMGRGLSAAGRGLGRGASAAGRGLGRGASAAGRALGREAGRAKPYAGTLKTGAARPYAFSGAGEADFYAQSPSELPLRTGSMDELARGERLSSVSSDPSPSPDDGGGRMAKRVPQTAKPVQHSGMESRYSLPAPAQTAAVDPLSLLDRDPGTLSGAEKDALFDFRRSQRQALSRFEPVEPVEPVE
ncbi:MAG: hypothetical protein JAY75_07670, partial [Candidatus Thiodiazotropha taylori]|nr:hypothetical protein [Candidatus Thiodiazotropha taylori]MCW4261634.1 hypothetical protein [Candidatus Thiodiazotropha endolucinida]MCG8032803.1 hypothetical protein [Candidatus Thiodiazotropha taylori]MCG8076102.1 hypothetical protein [Candidatus Thiodiazotropha taylori]MCG8117852.1 hypothetical protein [Candidatus Thiodiazotropha taylori]